MEKFGTLNVEEGDGLEFDPDWQGPLEPPLPGLPITTAIVDMSGVEFQEAMA